MSKMLMFEDNGVDVLGELFKIRKEDIETQNADDKEFVKENNIYEVTEESLIENINSLSNIADETKKELTEKIKTLVENKEEMEAHMVEKYYKTGVKDVINIMMSKV